MNGRCLFVCKMGGKIEKSTHFGRNYSIMRVAALALCFLTCAAAFIETHKEAVPLPAGWIRGHRELIHHGLSGFDFVFYSTRITTIHKINESSFRVTDLHFKWYRIDWNLFCNHRLSAPPLRLHRWQSQVWFEK